MDLTNQKEKVEFAEKSVDFFIAHKERKASFKEMISSNSTNYDRHFTSTSKFSLVIENAGGRFSGGRATVWGTSTDQYDIDIMHMVLGEIEGNVIIIIEKLDGNYTRRSEITIQ